MQLRGMDIEVPPDFKRPEAGRELLKLVTSEAQISTDTETTDGVWQRADFVMS